jgi:hypothetical protein
MSTRSLITTIAVLAALLTFPVVASARFSDVGPLNVQPQSQPAVPAPTSEPVATTDGGGSDTSTILLVVGLTLVAGAAIGAGRAVARERRGRTAHA